MAITVDEGRNARHFYGLSTDTKETSPPVGSTFYETDTEKTYKYTGNWVEIDTLATIDVDVSNIDLNTDGIETKLDTLHTDIGTTLHGDMDGVEGKLDTVNTNLGTLEDDVEALHTDIATTLAGKVDTVNTNLGTMEDDVETLVSRPYSVTQAPTTATGSAAISTTVQPAYDWELIGIKVHLNAAGASGNLTVTEDANAGAEYDTVHLTQDMTSVTNLDWFPAVRIPFVSGDKAVIAWANAGGKTYGLTVYYARRY